MGCIDDTQTQNKKRSTDRQVGRRNLVDQLSSSDTVWTDAVEGPFENFFLWAMGMFEGWPHFPRAPQSVFDFTPHPPHFLNVCVRQRFVEVGECFGLAKRLGTVPFFLPMFHRFGVHVPVNNLFDVLRQIARARSWPVWLWNLLRGRFSIPCCWVFLGG